MDLQLDSTIFFSSILFDGTFLLLFPVVYNFSLVFAFCQFFSLSLKSLFLACGRLGLLEDCHFWRSLQVNGYISSQRSQAFQGIVSEGSLAIAKESLTPFVSCVKEGSFESLPSLAADPVVCLTACWVPIEPD